MAKHLTHKAFSRLCQKLFESTPLCYFALSVTNLHQNCVSFISSHPDFNIEMFSENFPFLAPFLDEGYYSADGIYTEVPKRYAEHELDNVFYIIKKKDDLIYCYTFASQSHKPSVINFYFNHLDYLDKFILYFEEQGQELLEELLQDSFTMPHHIKPELYSQLLHEQITEEPLVINKFYNPDTKKWIVLSKREREVLLHAVIHGKTAIKTGEIMKVSPKTVENYLANLRTKLHAKTKGDLLKRAIDIGIIKLQTFF